MGASFRKALLELERRVYDLAVWAVFVGIRVLS